LTSVHLHIGAGHVATRLAILDRERLPLGEVAFGQLLLERHIGALDSRFVFSHPAMRRTLESGFVVDP
jgi:hypothetical protein